MKSKGENTTTRYHRNLLWFIQSGANEDKRERKNKKREEEERRREREREGLCFHEGEEAAAKSSLSSTLSLSLSFSRIFFESRSQNSIPLFLCVCLPSFSSLSHFYPFSPLFFIPSSLFLSFFHPKKCTLFLFSHAHRNAVIHSPSQSISPWPDTLLLLLHSSKEHSKTRL